MGEDDQHIADHTKRMHEVRDHYVAVFDPSEYCSTFYAVLDDEVKFFLKCYHHAFKKDPILKEREQNQRRVLDFGCGPVPVYAATAASFTNTITLAEMVLANRKEINSWMNSDADAYDWGEFFQYLDFLEDEANGEGGADVAQKLRDAFQLVIPCDGALSNPLSPICQTYDVIMSTLCLEFATTSLADYNSMMGNVVRLLRPGGVLLLAGALGNTSYSIGRQQYPSVKLKEEDIVRALDKHGFSMVSFQTLQRQTSRTEKPADHSAVFFLIARRD